MITFEDLDKIRHAMSDGKTSTPLWMVQTMRSLIDNVECLLGEASAKRNKIKELVEERTTLKRLLAELRERT